ncbi:hypothetical protein R50072_22010 [Simiduia litorea]|uniref:hypothetical protein n=1 Tax=Simiduia litorea TaxID=1435348 RepID=UPI0036F1E6FA
MRSSSDHSNHNVFDFFTGKRIDDARRERFIRISPELDGLEILYANDSDKHKLFSLKILCWALRENGEVVGLVPWLNNIVACPEINDPLNGKFEGYYDPGLEEIFHHAPIHKIVELESAAEYYESSADSPDAIVQEIPDTIGTHAVLSKRGSHSLTLSEVVSWRLHFDGSISGMLVDPEQVASTPVLPGDSCLFAADTCDSFRYYFQHQIANKIKSQDPEAIAAISALVDEGS